MVSSTAQNFSAAMKRIVKSMPYGSQTEIAEKLGVSRQYLTDLLSGRKRWTDELKDKASHALGTPVQDLLAIGEILIESGQYFPYVREVRPLAPNSPERAEWIMKRAGRDAGLGDVRFLSVSAVQIWCSNMINQYLKGKETDADLYESALTCCKKILKKTT